MSDMPVKLFAHPLSFYGPKDDAIAINGNWTVEWNHPIPPSEDYYRGDLVRELIEALQERRLHPPYPGAPEGETRLTKAIAALEENNQ